MNFDFPPLETDLSIIAGKASLSRNDDEAFRYYIELDERTDDALDSFVATVATPVIEAIDCTDCANCCRNLDVFLTEADAARLANGINVTITELETTVIDRNVAQASDEWGVFQQKPCQFLVGKLCGVYDHRPESCRIYPVFVPDFRWMLEDLFEGIGLCPIIYNVVEHLKIALNW